MNSCDHLSIGCNCARASRRTGAEFGVDRRVLQRAMKVTRRGSTGRVIWLSLVRRRMAAVAEIYQRIIYQQQTRGRSRLPARIQLLSALEPATRTSPASRS